MEKGQRIRIHECLLAWCLALVSLSASTPLPSLESLKVEGARNSVLLSQSDSSEDIGIPEPALDVFKSEIQPLLTTHCVPCHGPKKAKARIRVDELDPNLLEGNDVDWWLEIMAVLGNGEMPPPDESELTGEDRGKILDWLSGEMRMASIRRRADGGHSSFRRLTRYEYNYALQDLLGLPWEFARDLPPEAPSEDGFQNSSETLHMSVAQLETYRRLARKALMRATVRGPRPPVLHWGVTMKQRGKIEWDKQDAKIAEIKEKYKDDPDKQKKELDRLLADSKKPRSRAYFKNLTSGETVPHSWAYYGAKYAHKPSDSPPELPPASEHIAVLPPGSNRKLVVELGEKLPDEGIMRVRVRAAGRVTDGYRVPNLQLEFGWQASNEGRALLRVSQKDQAITATPDAPEFYEWRVPLGDIYPRNSVRKTSPLGAMPNPSEHIRLVNSSASRGEVQIDYVEVAAPVYDQWPPESHRRIFFESPNRENEAVYAREILSAFMTRAWRRPIGEDELERKHRLFRSVRKASESFEEAVVEVLATVLSAPDFLYVVGDEWAETGDEVKEADQLSEHELATRLALFLWCSVPDDTLLMRARQGELKISPVLEIEVRRLLADPRSERFAQHFVRQWLDMQLLDYVETDRKLSPLLKEAMQREPILLFQEMLRRDETVLSFIHSDYTVADERLAFHYGIPKVYGNHFRVVKLSPKNRRGGLLTQAGLLAMNSSGKDSNPLKRGIWMLESLLNDPPPPPPPAVPEIDLADPEIAKMSLKERIEDHRNHAACMSCHIKIDPWGIAFENYDARGRWRDDVDGKPVDASSLLFNNEVLDGMDGLKRFLLMNRQDQFVRAMVHKMCVFALGRPLSFADRAAVDAIAAQVRREGDGLATLVMKVAMSDLFLSK